MENDIVKMLFFQRQRQKKRWKIKTISGAPPLSFKAKAGALKDYRIYGNTAGGEAVGDLETAGEHAGEYKVPVTVSNGADTQTIPIYLPEQIKMVGDEAEYIDYGEQKQHRVRKNLLNYSSIEIGRFDFSTGEKVPDSSQLRTSTPIKVKPNESYAISGVASGQVRVFLYDGNMNMISTVLRSDNSVVETTGSTGKKISLVLNGVRACTQPLTSFEVDLCASIMPSSDDVIVLAHTLIEDTELNVTLPALPTLSGTNILSIGTTVQPSKVYIKGEKEREYT